MAVRRACLTGVLASLACAPASSPTAPPSTADAMLTVSLLPSEEIPTAVRMEVANDSPVPIEFCRYHTAFEGLRNDIFEVRDPQGAVLEYRGPMAKRAAPEREDFFVVQPGRFHTAEVDLALGYALGGGQTYVVRYRGSEISGLPDSAPLELPID